MTATQKSKKQTTNEVNTDRLWADLMKIAEFTEPDAPYTRRVFSPLFKEARKWLTERFQEAGLSTRLDTAGNLIGRLEGSDPACGTIMIGSHSDTVAGGGRFDGVAGVICALEIARAIKEKGYKPRHNIEVVDFLGEEPNKFGLSCVGSRAMSAHLEDKMLAYKDPSSGETLEQAIASIGGKPAQLKDSKRSDVKAFFELHIEQGPVLENEAIDIGIVTGIVGIRRIEIKFTGEADHAGTTPMHMRRDASQALAESILYINKLAGELAEAGEGHFVATTGVAEITPNAANVVPGTSRLIIDARSESRPLMEQFYAAVDAATEKFAAERNVTRDGPHILSDTTPAICDAALQGILRESAHSVGLSTRHMASGAGHDCAFVSRIAPSAMVFVPCKAGKSHAANEWAEPDALAEGSSTIVRAIIEFDQSF
ncbi:MAG TPA: Zn-dependent hydrolase [Chroococcales cyanobacterium]